MIYAITGGTGTLGTALTHTLLQQGHKVRAIARGEHKLAALEDGVPPSLRSSLSAQCGDVRSPSRLRLALRGVDCVIHAAALKGVPRCEYDPGEAVLTNIQGTVNVALACVEAGVKRAVFISSDKACAPVTLYGMTKAVGERVWLAANRYSAGEGTEFVATRWGNVFGSNGSVMHVWKGCNGADIPITDPGSTRFHITIEQAVEFVMRTLKDAKPDEIWLPKLPSYELGSLAKLWGGGQKIIGLRNGEKRHEFLISEEESATAIEYEDRYVLTPGKRQCKGGWAYSSGGNGRWLKRDEAMALINEVKNG